MLMKLMKGAQGQQVSCSNFEKYLFAHVQQQGQH